MYVCGGCGKWSLSYWDCSECGFKMHDRKAEEEAYSAKYAPRYAEIQGDIQRRRKAKMALKAQKKRLRRMGKK